VVYEVELVELRYVVVVGAYVDSVGRGYEQVGGVGQHGQGTTVAGTGTRIQGSFTTDEGMSMLCVECLRIILVSPRDYEQTGYICLTCSCTSTWGS
jgi:hypothetical protein